MATNLRGRVAIVGIGEVPTRRTYPGRTTEGLGAEAASLALTHAGLRKEMIDGIITQGGTPVGTVVDPGHMAQYIGLRPTWASGVTVGGANGTTALTVASMAVETGVANYVMVILGGARDPNVPEGGGPRPAGYGSEFEAPYGPAAGANTPFSLIYQRHMYEYGTTTEQLAHLMVHQRFNALQNPNAAFQGQPITLEDVLNSRIVNSPLHLLECVMPCAGAAACIVTSAEQAKALPNRPVYFLGSGLNVQPMGAAQGGDRLTETAVKISAPRAFAMAGYNAKEMQFAEFYD